MKSFNFFINLFCVALMLSVIPAFIMLISPSAKLDRKVTTVKTKSQAAVVREAAVKHSSSEFISSVDFYGGASHNSKFQDGELIFETLDRPSWSYAKIDFKENLNLRENILTFSAKGKKGSEVLKIVLTDNQRRTTYTDELYSVALTTKLQKISISADDISSLSVDKSRISSLKFLMGSSGEEKGSGVIYLKDIILSKKQN